MNSEILKAKLAELAANTSQGNRMIWKPSEGENKVRLIPYIHSNDDWPFTEIFIHYEVATIPFISPRTFGRPDPIADFGESVRADAKGNAEMYKIAKVLTPKRMYVVPILVRGRESSGVKFWPCTEAQYSKLLQFINEPAYGDITDPHKGCDIKITMTKATKPGEFNSINMMPLPSSPITDRSDILELCGKMPEVYSNWEEPSYDQLVDLLRRCSEVGYKSVPLKANGVQPNAQAQTHSATQNTPQVNASADASTSAPPQSSAPSLNNAFDKYFKK